jgi:hypothetical protein
VQRQPAPLVARADDGDGIGRQLRRRRDLGDHPAVGATELQLTVRLALDLVARLVDGDVVTAAEQGQIAQRGGAALGPVPEVMALAEGTRCQSSSTDWPGSAASASTAASTWTITW